MTQQRIDEHSTEFGLWLRKQDEIDSQRGYVASNLDYVWRNWKNKKWMIIEEKRHKSEIKFWQKQIFDILDEASKNDPNYCGFYFIQFENTSPDDGRIWINREEKTKDDLIELLKFETKNCSRSSDPKTETYIARKMKFRRKRIKTVTD